MLISKRHLQEYCNFEHRSNFSEQLRHSKACTHDNYSFNNQEINETKVNQKNKLYQRTMITIYYLNRLLVYAWTCILHIVSLAQHKLDSPINITRFYKYTKLCVNTYFYQCKFVREKKKM